MKNAMYLVIFCLALLSCGTASVENNNILDDQYGPLENIIINALKSKFEELKGTLSLIETFVAPSLVDEEITIIDDTNLIIKSLSLAGLSELTFDVTKVTINKVESVGNTNRALNAEITLKVSWEDFKLRLEHKLETPLEGIFQLLKGDGGISMDVIDTSIFVSVSIGGVSLVSVGFKTLHIDDIRIELGDTKFNKLELGSLDDLSLILNNSMKNPDVMDIITFLIADIINMIIEGRANPEPLLRELSQPIDENKVKSFLHFLKMNA